MAGKIKVAVAQVNSVELAQNTRVICETLREAADAGITLVVFPECAVTGYVFDSRAAVEAAAVDIDGDEMSAIRTSCKDLAIHAVVGFLERDRDRVFNTAVLFGPSGVIGSYRKRHLPFNGADRFTDASDEVDIAVFGTSFGRVGIAICYEIRFPEVIRTLALAGADIVALPTAWPTPSELLATHFTRVRAAENFVYLLTANHCGKEVGETFLGISTVTHPSGDVLIAAQQEEGLFAAEVDVDVARNKRIVFREGDFEVNPWRDRRPESYKL
jgi:predicted amidohydrolase